MTSSRSTDRPGWPDEARSRAVDGGEGELARLLLEAAFHANPDAMLLFRSAGDYVIDANEAWHRITGTSRAEVIGRPLAALAFWADPADAGRLVEALRADEGRGSAVRDFEVAFRRPGPDGAPEQGWAVLSAVPVAADDATYSLLWCRDVTAERRAHERRRQLRRFEELGRLAGGVAHDFNNLLTVIHSYAGFIRESVGGGQPVAPSDIEEIVQAVKRGRELARQLLAFGRSQPLAERIVDLNEALLSTEGMLRSLLGRRIALEFQLADALPPILADPVQIDQVVLNLAVNAADAMPDGGRLTIATRRVRSMSGSVAADGLEVPAGDYVVLDVADIGHGMDAATQARAFEPFFTTKGPMKGTGLGLAIVAGVARQAGGGVRVGSAPGRGTTLSVLWPVAMPIDPPPEEAPDGVFHRPCVMVVEDDDTVRHTMRRLLDQAGYDTAEARDGQDALERLAARWTPGTGPGLIVADVVMPRMGGRELAARLAEVRPDLPVVLVSALGDGDRPAAGLANVIVPVLQKPFDADALVDRVRTTFERWPAHHATRAAGS